MDNKIKVTVPNQGQLEIEVLDIFNVADYEGKDYILYTLGEEVDSDHEKAYVSILKGENNNYSLLEITDPQEWEQVQLAINEELSLEGDENE